MHDDLIQRRALLQASACGIVASLAGHAGAAAALQARRPSERPSPASSPEEARCAPRGLESDLAAAERVLGLSFTHAERQQLVRGYDEVLQTLDRIRQWSLPNDLSSALRFDPRLPGKTYTMPVAGIRGAPPSAGALPSSEAEIALSPAWQLASWLRVKAISSTELTRLYLKRIERLGPQLANFITVTDDLALRQAAQTDADLARGRIRSALHGVPYGLKDLFDVEGVHTTWGAEPYRERIASFDAAIVDKLRAAGTVLLGKTAVGALAYGDIWHGGVSRNPWNPDEGSSGSSAGSASATAAGLVGFSIGTETLGSIVSPSHRCGTAGLRPTFGRVSRHGAMSLCWSWDKVGPIARTVADCALVLGIINGGDTRDWGSLDAPFGFDWGADVRRLRVGYVPGWFDGEGATEVDRGALDSLRATGASVVEVDVPELPYAALVQLVILEAAATFSELTLTNRDDELTWQDDDAWPNTLRRARLFPAVDMLQLERLRRRVMIVFDDLFAKVDVLFGPNLAGGMLPATNATGHPCLVMKAGFIRAPSRKMTDAPIDPQGPGHRVPRAISLWGNLFREDALVSLGRVLEASFGVVGDHPPIAR